MSYYVSAPLSSLTPLSVCTDIYPTSCSLPPHHVLISFTIPPPLSLRAYILHYPPPPTPLSLHVLISFTTPPPLSLSLFVLQICGIGKVTERLLQGLGVTTCNHLYQQRATLNLLFSSTTSQHFLRIAMAIGDTNVHSYG